MTHEEQRIWLIRQLLAEEPAYAGLTIPKDARGQKNMLRALMNVRPPRAIGSAFLDVQDAYLKAEIAADGVVDADALPPFGADPRIALWQGDVTRLKADAIVNPANPQMLGCFQPLHGCADNWIGSRAGIGLRLACSRIMAAQGHEEPAGRAKITPGFNLPAKYILHTVGPVCRAGVPTEKDRELLASCYRSCYTLAADSGCRSIAFLCIATGVYMFPNEPAAEIAVTTVRTCLAGDPRIARVVFAVLRDRDRELYEALLTR